ncbi:MAG: hypothetical protein ACXWVJ_06305 [Caulobacteraceae bacterium]
MTVLLAFLAATSVHAAPQPVNGSKVICRYEVNQMGMVFRACQTKASNEEKAYLHARWLRDLQQRATQTRN